MLFVIFRHLKIRVPAPHVAISNELLEGSVDGRANFGAFVKIDRGDRTFTDTLWSELEFL